MPQSIVAAGNWKMHKTVLETQAFIKGLASQAKLEAVRIILAPPFTALESAVAAAKGTGILIAAQNMHDAEKGAFTGEISASMLQSLGVDAVMLGHSERRHVFGEDDAFVNRKLHAASAHGLISILCVGELIHERKAGKTMEVLKRQLQAGLSEISPKAMLSVMLAYEPVWAIGTGETASPEIAQEAHAYIRQELAALYSADLAAAVPILYGGSVKPGNVRALLEQSDIEGVLVGGASLEIESFAQIVNCEATLG